MTLDQQAICDLVIEWHRATGAGEINAVLRLIAEDAVFLVPGQPPMRGRNTFERGLRQVLASYRIESRSDIQEIVVSGELGYCWSALSVRMTPLYGGDASERAGHVLSIFYKQSNGSWVLVRDANLLPPPS